MANDAKNPLMLAVQVNKRRWPCGEKHNVTDQRDLKHKNKIINSHKNISKKRKLIKKQPFEIVLFFSSDLIR